MQEAFKKHIKTSFPELGEHPFIIACSGGVDSMVLSHLCNENRMDFALAHCNFMLRGKESDADEDLVRNFANSCQRDIFVKHFDTASYVSKSNVSIQMGARELRYVWFKELVSKNDYKYVLTAHHLDDNLETFLINLSRGTGLDGLTGIPEKTSWLARPLLPFTRKEILAYAKAQHIKWRDDSTNTDTKYLRNKIRKDIVPQLKTLHPTFITNFTKTQDYLSSAAEIIGKTMDSFRSKYFNTQDNIIHIPCDKLLELDPLKDCMYYLFKDYGFTEWDDVVNLLTAMSGKQVHSKTHRLIKDREHLLLQALEGSEASETDFSIESTAIMEPIHLLTREVSAIEEVSKEILYVDKETLNHKLTLRKWKKGDYFYPLGMRGRKKVSKFFKDCKMDAIAKEQQWLLCSDKDIIWIVGMRADERFKITDKTKHILQIRLG